MFKDLNLAGVKEEQLFLKKNSLFKRLENFSNFLAKAAFIFQN